LQLTHQIENVSFEFSDPKMERLVTLTSADRKWMDDMVRVVDETWSMVSFFAIESEAHTSPRENAPASSARTTTCATALKSTFAHS
jgi:hypothetical protein